MADPNDTMRLESVPPDGRPRRPPPIIDGEAVEVSVDGARTTPGAGRAAARRWLTRVLIFMSLPRLALIAAASVVAVIAAASLSVFLAPDSIEGPQQTAAMPGAAVRDDAAVRDVNREAIAQAAPPRGSPENRTDKTVETKDLEKRVAALDGALASLSGRIAALDRTVRDAAAAARAAAERADKVGRQLDEAKTSGNEQEAAQQLDRGALDDLASRIRTLESRQMALRQVQERLDHLANAAANSDKPVRVAIAAAALRNAVERDRPFADELAAARILGLDERVLAPLGPFAATGLPTRNELFRELSALLPELRRASAPPGQDLSYLDRLQASAVRMLNIRRVKDEPGDDPPIVLSRIEFKMIQQDIDAIIAELDKLPAQAKELAEPWRTKALARRNAIEASRLLATAALRKLGEPATSGLSPQ